MDHIRDVLDRGMIETLFIKFFCQISFLYRVRAGGGVMENRPGGAGAGEAEPRQGYFT